MSAEEEQVEVTLEVNGREVEMTVPSRWTLADLLREGLGLTGTRIGCEQGICGACTVLLDGEPVRACLLFAWQARGRSVVSIEGAEDSPEVRAVQASVEREQAFQCGYCTPGFVMLLGGYLAANPDAGDEELVEAASANICRCTGYADLLAAARRAREALNGG